MQNNHDGFVQTLIDQLPDWFDSDEFALAQMGRQYYPYTQLFSPIRINSIEIKNRVVMGPMGNISMAEEMGRPAGKMIQYFTERARGGVGLITSGLVPVSQGIDPSVTERNGQSYFPRIDASRTVFAGWRDLAESIHAYGAHFFIQLTPGLGRVGSPESLMTKYKLPVSASWNPNFYLPDVPCRPLTDGQLRHIIRRTAQASADAKAAAIDGVYLHGHEGYLLEQLTNRAFNRRKLGRYADWQAFGIDLIAAIREMVGPKYPIMYRIDLSLALNAIYGERLQEIKSLRKFTNERTVEETLDYMVNLVRAGVDVFDVDLGCYDNWWLPHPPNTMPSGCFLEAARLVKDHFIEQGVLSNAGISVPVVGVGKLGYPDIAEKALRDGDCDMVMLARPLLADPEWANKAYSGRVDEIRPCIGDQEGCINEFVNGGHPQCAVNPRMGFEDVIPAHLPLTTNPKRIAVLGAGPAGIHAALTAAYRGHHVTLIERRDRVGGMLVPGSVPKTKYEVRNYLHYLQNRVEDAIKHHELLLMLNKSITIAELRKGAYDTVVVCDGAVGIEPMIPGIEQEHVIQATELFRSGGAEAETARNIVVVGGGAVGCECAHWLASEKGKQVTVVEMLPYLMKDLCTANRGHLIHEMEKNGVSLLNCTSLMEIVDHQVKVERNVSPTVPSPYNTWQPVLPENIHNPLAKPIQKTLEEQLLEADLVVLALGLRPNTDFYRDCFEARVAPQVLRIGDAFRVGRVFEAVKAGFQVGMHL
ncbi:MAG: FAD-dependent oxidoreductase [Anaerolineaceae bacterium]|nr:FAD-dependent oxidoreductase [Anaerolineaceae bacterium]